MIGDLLYETADIAFDTATGRFRNPKTGADLGTNVPAGGWPISWYQAAGGGVVVPVGSGAVSQSETEAAQLLAKVQKDLNSVNAIAGATGTTVNTQQSGGSTATTGSSTPGTVASTNSQNSTFPGSVLSKIPDFPALDFMGIKWYWWAAGAVAVFMMMKGGGHQGRYRNPSIRWFKKAYKKQQKRLGGRMSPMHVRSYRAMGRASKAYRKELRGR